MLSAAQVRALPQPQRTIGHKNSNPTHELRSSACIMTCCFTVLYFAYHRARPSRAINADPKKKNSNHTIPVWHDKDDVRPHGCVCVYTRFEPQLPKPTTSPPRQTRLTRLGSVNNGQSCPEPDIQSDAGKVDYEIDSSTLRLTQGSSRPLTYFCGGRSQHATLSISS